MNPTRKPRNRQRRSTLQSARPSACASDSTPRDESCSSIPTECGAATSCAPESPSFQCVEKIALDVVVEEEKHPSKPDMTHAVLYVLHVRHGTCDVAWTHRRSLPEYLDFQAQLLQILEQGHACSGDCPWLYSFLKSYFPRPSSCRFKLLCPIRIARRRDALALCLTTLRSFLLTRENQSCTVLRRSVLKAFTGFVYGELGPSHPLLSRIEVSEEVGAESPVSSRASTAESEESSDAAFDSSQSSAFSDASGSSADAAGLLAIPACALCRSRLDEEAAPFSLPVGPLPPPAPTSLSSTNSSSSSNNSGPRYYATKLRCGHEFHDECILAFLNQELSCPLCGLPEVSPRSDEQRRASSLGSFSRAATSDGVQGR
ncbi:hypothetical protein PybrP1_000678 [[Pythium] brassicae (nom. inval.)]|nr:hypothetical protein PybrP1_000678 [[Pythium] brassicae (nom. inval.)]